MAGSTGPNSRMQRMTDRILRRQGKIQARLESKQERLGEKSEDMVRYFDRIAKLFNNRTWGNLYNLIIRQ